MFPDRNADRADDVGMMHAYALVQKALRQQYAIIGRDMLAARASLARVMRRHGDQPATAPVQLIFELASKLGSPLIRE